MMTPLLLAAVQTLTFNADRVAVDNVTKTAAATGHVVATAGPLTLRSEALRRDLDGAYVFQDPTCVTTCTNAPGHLHWSATAGLVYRENDSVTVDNLCLRLYEIPVFWLPRLWYPLDTDCGFSWMPGYMGRWGAYLLTKYQYHLLGDPEHQDTTWWLAADTRFDLRYRQGLALGEDFDWNLGDFGRGSFKFYCVWDQDADDDGRRSSRYSRHWRSEIDYDRYAIELVHRWEATERDSVLARAACYSDSSFRSDFFRRTFFESRSQWLGYEGSGVFWEHLENAFAIGAEVSGPLNTFYGMTGRAPEVYFDLHPIPLWDLPINYETENRIGYLTRSAAEYVDDRESVFSPVPGRWAEYEAFRFDTYHRLTAPFKVADVLSVVPRIGYHGTFWSNGGQTDLEGWNRAGSLSGDGLYRSVLEGGATFAGRGAAWIGETWQHVAEPYLDVLAQEAWYAGNSGRSRPYVFDAIDASRGWEDQFAGRSRNLPYSYYGVTPGWRNAWRQLDERGSLRTVLDVDVYAALQFRRADHWGTDDRHKLAEPDSPNYGKNEVYASPGTRVRWKPADDVTLGALLEYDPDYNRLARADVAFNHRLDDKLAYNVSYVHRDYRYWDFASSPYDPEQVREDAFNLVKFGSVRVGVEQEIVDWLAWGPFIRWDTNENELDSVGTWIDYLTDCLGFRFLVEYENSFTRIDGYEHGDDWNFGFYIYLRCFGADRSNIFSGF